MTFGKRGTLSTSPIARTPDVVSADQSDLPSAKRLVFLFGGTFAAALGLMFFWHNLNVFVWKKAEARLDAKFNEGFNDPGGFKAAEARNKSTGVDLSCFGMWTARSFRFRDAMYCFSTRAVERLCDPQARAAYVSEVGRYLDAHRMVKNPTAADWQTIVDLPSNAGSDQNSHAAVVRAWQRLAERGLLSTGDFGWFPPKEIADAIGDVEVSGNACARG